MLPELVNDLGLRASGLALAVALLAVGRASDPGSGAGDWPQFRGPGALGRSEAKALPLHWGEDTNLVWKTDLPGPGASSPITRGRHIFLTCFTGYSTSAGDPGDLREPAAPAFEPRPVLHRGLIQCGKEEAPTPIFSESGKSPT